MNKTLPKLLLLAIFLPLNSVSAMDIGNSLPVTVSTSSTLDLNFNLKLGSTDSKTKGEVTKLQNFLRRLGFLDALATGFFGNKTKESVIRFQNSKQISTTGNVGPITRNLIKIESVFKSDKVSKPQEIIISNLNNLVSSTTSSIIQNSINTNNYFIPITVATSNFPVKTNEELCMEYTQRKMAFDDTEYKNGTFLTAERLSRLNVLQSQYPITCYPPTIIPQTASLIKNTSFSDQNISKTTKRAKIGSFLLQTNEGEEVSVTGFTVRFSGSLPISSLKNLEIESVGMITAPLLSQASFASIISMPKNTSRVINVFVDIDSVEDLNLVIDMTVNSRGLSSLLSKTTDPVIGQTITTTN